MLRVLMLLLVSVGMLNATPICLAASLAAYMDYQAEGCLAGDRVFSNVSYSVSGDNYTGADGISVAVTGGGLGFYSAGFRVGTKESVTYTIEYTVTAAADIFKGMLAVAHNFGRSGDGSASFFKRVRSETSSLGSVTILAGPDVSTSAAAIEFLSPRRVLRVRDQLTLIGGIAGSASIDGMDNIPATVPEPSNAALAAAASGVAVSLVRARRRRQAVQ